MSSFLDSHRGGEVMPHPNAQQINNSGSRYIKEMKFVIAKSKCMFGIGAVVNKQYKGKATWCIVSFAKATGGKITGIDGAISKRSSEGKMQDIGILLAHHEPSDKDCSWS
jgi:hypothetical protein